MRFAWAHNASFADHPHRAGQLPYLTGSQIALGIDAGQMRLLDATHD